MKFVGYDEKIKRSILYCVCERDFFEFPQISLKDKP